MPIEDYTTEQQMLIRQAVYDLDKRGKPEIGAKINYQVSEGASFSALEKLWKPKTVKAEIPVADPTMAAPPLIGKGSGIVAWQNFAKEVSDMDPEVIDAMSKPDIMTVLKDKGVIDDG